MMPPCPKCQTTTKPHPDQSYYGEMYECPACGFMAYFDAWNENGEYEGEQSEPF